MCHCCPGYTLTKSIFALFFARVFEASEGSQYGGNAERLGPQRSPGGPWPHRVPALVTATTHSSEFWDRHLLLVLALDCKWEHLRWDESLARLGHRHTVPRASWQGRPIPSLGRLIPDQLPAKPHDPPRTGSQATCTAEPALAAVWGHCDTSPPSSESCRTAQHRLL